MATAEDVAPAAVPGLYQRASETAQYLRQLLPEAVSSPKVAIVCGSGLGGLADSLEPEPRVEVAYEKIPNFPRTTGKTMLQQFNYVAMHKLHILAATLSAT
jgi:purine nucleoside phosphorylase